MIHKHFNISLQNVLGFHTNLAVALTLKAISLTLLGTVMPSYVVEPNLQERMYPLSDHLKWFLLETGYFHSQATKPDTLGEF